MLEKGLQHTSRSLVGPDNSARGMGSGDLDVLATPGMIALMENAALCAVVSHLPEGTTTVGAHIQTSHVRPTPLGEEVEATALLEEIEGRKLTFRVVARDATGIIGEGVHIRYVVDKTKFLSKLSSTCK